MKREDINKALNVLTDLTVDYGNRNAEEIKELDDALDVVEMAAQAYEQLGADAYKTAVQDDRNKEYARGFAESRKAVESILEGQGVLFQTTDADFRDVDTITLQPKKGDAVKYIRAKRGSWEPMSDRVKTEKEASEILIDLQKALIENGLLIVAPEIKTALDIAIKNLNE